MARNNNVVQPSQAHESQPDQRLVLLHQVVAEGIRQAKQSADQAYWSFLVATVLSTASALAGLSGAGFLLFGNASEGTVTTTVGLASGMYSGLSRDKGKKVPDDLEALSGESLKEAMIG